MLDNDLERTRAKLADGLPERARWMVGPTSLAFSFFESRQPLRTLAELVGSWDEPIDTARYRVFGAQSYSDGGGATPVLVLSEVDGSILAFDAESNHVPLRFLNSGADQFVRSFNCIDHFLARQTGSFDEVRRTLAAIDPVGFQRSEWCELIDELAYHANA